jgi:hypothetical protein
MINLLIGAILAIIGGIIGQIVESRFLRKNKRNEYIAKLEVDAVVWIYPLFKKIMTYLDHQNKDNPKFEDAEKIVVDSDARFWEIRLLLPSGIPECWIACRNAVIEKNRDEATKQAQLAFPIMCERFDLKEFP